VQAKGIENIFNKIIEENFPSLEKQVVSHTTTRGFQKTTSPRHVIFNTLNS
jgi:hypothetical protein